MNRRTMTGLSGLVVCGLVSLTGIAIAQQKPLKGEIVGNWTLASAETTEANGNKTTLVKGIAEGFRAAKQEDVTSPTFTLVHEYRGPRVAIFHIDLYRIDTPRELDTLALDDLRSENSILLIEWGEKFQRILQQGDVEISIESVADNSAENDRRITINTSAPASAGTES